MSTPLTPYPSSEQQAPSVGDTSLGELIHQVTTDLSTLVRQELELARAELKTEAAKAAKGGAMLGGAGYAGLMLGVFASLTLMFLLDLAMPTWLAALIVTVLWGITGAVLFTRGRERMKTVHPTPTQTVASLKETF